MNTQKLAAMALLVSGLLAGNQAHAALSTNSAGFGGVDEDFESFDGLVVPSPWPVMVAGGSVIVTADSTMTLGAFAVDLNENGTWGAGNNFAGIGDLVNGGSDFDGSLYLSFAPAFGVGALFGIYQDSTSNAAITIEAYGSNYVLLESYSFVIDFADAFLSNAGLFYGITRESADIVGLRISGDGLVFDDLRVSSTPVPLPAALPLLLAGVGMLGLSGMSGRRRS